MKTRTVIKKAGMAVGVSAVGVLAAVGAVSIASDLTSDPDGSTSLSEPDAAAETTSPPVTSPAPSTSQAPQSTIATPELVPEGVAFAETFDGNEGLDRFDRGVWHRDDHLVATTSWTGDHDESCGTPASQRPIQRDRPDDSFYTCRDHMMTSVGDTSGYSIAWFSPQQAFNGQTTVSVDVNSTYLGRRQWWEVGLIPADYASGTEGCELCFAEHSATENVLPGQPDNSFVFGLQVGGGRIMTDYQNTRELSKLCNDANPVDPEGCESKPIRRTWTVTDNGDGTVTLEVLGQSAVLPGSFPEGDWRLVIKDHNYTPIKSEDPVGFTWHWDNIIVS